MTQDPDPSPDATIAKARTGPWTTKSDLAVLSRAHRQQLALYRQEQHAVRRRLQAARAKDPTVGLSSDDSERLSRVTTFLAKCTALVLELEAARAKVEAGLSPDALLEQLRYEFARAAWSYTDDELVILARGLKLRAWAVFDRIRCERTGAGQWVSDSEAV